ncbi:hypothetical protein Tco_0211076 [Tanacetum coccineum]
MAIMNSCNKHNMIACVEKTERNADFHDVIDFLTGCSVNYALLVSPDVAGKKILVSEASVSTDLMFNDEDGTNCFDNQCSPKFSGKLTPLTPPMLEVATTVRAEHSLHTEELDIPTSLHHVMILQLVKRLESPLSFKTKIKILVKKVKPLIAEYSSFVKLKATLSKKKKLKKAHKEKSSSFKQGRRMSSDGSMVLNEVVVKLGDSQ